MKDGLLFIFYSSKKDRNTYWRLGHLALVGRWERRDNGVEKRKENR
jgi:hypothetical protein